MIYTNEDWEWFEKNIVPKISKDASQDLFKAYSRCLFIGKDISCLYGGAIIQDYLPGVTFDNDVEKYIRSHPKLFLKYKYDVFKWHFTNKTYGISDFHYIVSNDPNDWTESEKYAIGAGYTSQPFGKDKLHYILGSLVNYIVHIYTKFYGLNKMLFLSSLIIIIIFFWKKTILPKLDSIEIFAYYGSLSFVVNFLFVSLFGPFVQVRYWASLIPLQIVSSILFLSFICSHLFKTSFIKRLLELTKLYKKSDN